MRPAYFDAYPTLAFDRDDMGILTVRLHSGGGEVQYSPQHHTDWSRAFVDIADDRENRVVVLTGTGEVFMDEFAWDRPGVTPQLWDQIYYEGKHLLRRLLDIEVPVVAAINGPATIHAELALLSDITIAADHSTFQDRLHVGLGAVPGDGVHVIWQELLGLNRGRYFLLTGQSFDAAEALELGLVNEVVPHEMLMEQAYAHARRLAALDPLTARYTRVVLTEKIKRLLDEQLGYGLALEALAGLDAVRIAREK